MTLQVDSKKVLDFKYFPPLLNISFKSNYIFFSFKTLLKMKLLKVLNFYEGILNQKKRLARMSDFRKSIDTTRFLFALI